MAAITPFSPIPANFPSHPLAERGIPLEMITSIQEEIDKILSLASWLKEDDLVAMIMGYTFLREHLGELAHPQFWSDRPDKQPSRIETLEMTLLELKRFEEKRIVICAKDTIAHPGLYEEQIPEHAGIKELEHILASAIYREKNTQGDDLCIIDQSQGLSPHEMLSLQRMGTRYEVHILQKKGMHPLRLLPKEQPVERLAPQLLEEDRQRTHALEPKRNRAVAAAEGEAKEEPPAAAEAPLLPSERQKEMIRENFVNTLLRQQGGVGISQKGSHITAHRKGKVSVTLVRPHGRMQNQVDTKR